MSDVHDAEGSAPLSAGGCDSAERDGAEGNGAERFRLEAELRRLQREAELARHTTAALTDRLRHAEAELAEGSGPVVVAMAGELARWQSRAGVAEAELARLRSNPLFRVAAPLWMVARVASRAPQLLARLAHRLS